MQVTKSVRKRIDHMMQTTRRTNRGRHSRRDAVLRHKRRRRALSKRRRALRLAGGFVPVNLDKKPQRSENLMDLIALDQIMPDPKRGEDHSPMPPVEGHKERGRGKNKVYGRLRAAFGKLGKLFSRKGF